MSFMDPPDNIKQPYDGYDDNLPEDEYVQLLTRWIHKLCHITDGPVFISFAEKWTPQIEIITMGLEIPVIQRIIWYYTFGQNSRTKYSPCFRPIYWLNKNTIYPQNIKIPSLRQTKYNDKRGVEGGKNPDNVWVFPRVCGTFKEKRKFHTNQHPEALLERIILGHSKPGDKILDPFVGSGTTFYVGEENNRHVTGIDQSEFYIDNIRLECQKRGIEIE